MSSPASHELSLAARVVGRVAAALILGIGVYGAVELLCDIHFNPIISIMAFDDRVYAQLTQPPPVTVPGVRPVILVDINDAALEHARRDPATGKDPEPNAESRTPRNMLADIVVLTSKQKAAAIFLDIDLRDPMPYDDRLQAAIETSSVPVLVPQFFSATQFPTCVTEPVTAPGQQPDLVPLAVGGNPPAMRVHYYFEVGLDSTVNGLCSAYLVGHYSVDAWTTLPAAMSEAVTIASQGPCRAPGAPADQPAPHEAQRPGPPPASILPITWRLDSNTTVFDASSSHDRVFRRIAAHLLKEPGTAWSSGQTAFVPAANVSFDVFHCAVVIVGSTARGTGHLVRTPIDDMPGALVHANAGLSLQDPGPDGIVARRAFDVLFLFFLPVVTALVCWLPLLRARKDNGLLFRLSGTILELFVSLALWLCVSAVVILAGRNGRLLGAWRFGIVSGVVSIGIVFLGAFLQPIADGAEDLVGGWWQAFARRRHHDDACPEEAGQHRPGSEP